MISIRFWGTVVAVKPRLTLAKFAGETTAHCEGYVAHLDGTVTEGEGAPAARRYAVSFGAATFQNQKIAVGDLLRGEAHPVPAGTEDVPADFYRVGVLRTIARATDNAGARGLPTDPPRSDPPLSPEDATVAPRRALRPENLVEDGPCLPCGYGVVVPVVRLSDPRDYRGGVWSHVPACLGPEDCPHFAPRDPA
jgi:hypothetical protein